MRQVKGKVNIITEVVLPFSIISLISIYFWICMHAGVYLIIYFVCPLFCFYSVYFKIYLIFMYTAQKN